MECYNYECKRCGATFHEMSKSIPLDHVRKVHYGGRRSLPHATLSGCIKDNMEAVKAKLERSIPLYFPDAIH